MDADFAANAALHVDFAKALQDRDRPARHLHDAIHRADFEARFAARAVVGVDDGDFLGQFLACT